MLKYVVHTVTTALKWVKADFGVIGYKQCQQGGEKLGSWCK